MLYIVTFKIHSDYRFLPVEVSESFSQIIVIVAQFGIM
jgi:hypothetical protein